MNEVSSPGPPLEEEEDPPYVIPPGPYPDEKPDLSYAALVGQAILTSRDHRLSLQHIYEWISTVYPHFKRTDQTWMNSIRHVLSTTAVFRKVARSATKSQWAIWDKDLSCFAKGGFDRKLCSDMNQRRVKPGPSKRRVEDVAGPKPKRFKRDSPTPAPPPFKSRYPPMLPNTSLHPYYISYAPASIVPLSATATAPLVTQKVTDPPQEESITPTTPPIPPSSSASSVPALTPNISSSSSPDLIPGDARIQKTEPEDLIIIQDPHDVPMEALEPSVTLLHNLDKPTKKSSRSKGKGRAKVRSNSIKLYQRLMKWLLRIAQPNLRSKSSRKQFRAPDLIPLPVEDLPPCKYHPL